MASLLMYETGHMWLNLGCALISNPSSVLGETEVTPVLPPLPHVGLAGSFKPSGQFCKSVKNISKLKSKVERLSKDPVI